ncbi:hypothetical protein COUCH_01960 [Couchioplanes caeruleus]|uniref:hypothetical protein n=1 Tax=Couchioplanes caeruleus TaxID=56438 RepID=UPI0020BEDF74|nr:hypothetical protein [Couchioplanes caeruleus]UQU65138.1 hypothetical protein COUCH_01960 [Couchioplanes caeruleus]
MTNPDTDGSQMSTEEAADIVRNDDALQAAHGIQGDDDAATDDDARTPDSAPAGETRDA